MTDIIAPGHVYRHQPGTGIKWWPGNVELWDKGQKQAEARHRTKTLFEYWYNLEFANSFPQVTHWWFRSGWTQQVRVTRSQGMMDGNTAWGLMQFMDNQLPGQVWTVTNTSLPMVNTPMPPLENQPINLPLRLALAQLVLGVIQDEIAPDTWYVITSLVKTDELEQVFSTSLLNWQIEGVNVSLRRALCHLQGLKEVDL